MEELLLGSVGSNAVVVEVPPPQAESTKAVRKHKARASQDPSEGRFARRLKWRLESDMALTLLWFLNELGSCFETCLLYSGAMNMLTKKSKLTLNQSVFGLSSLMLLLFGLWGSSAARAEWTKVDSYDAGTYYIDPDTVKKSGYIRSFWSILDYKGPQKTSRGLPYQSTRTHMEIDCRQKTVHILSFSMHAGPMLAGDVIDTQGIMRDWQSIPPDTPLEKLHKVVCTR